MWWRLETTVALDKISPLTDTRSSSTVQGETLGTLAAERALGVHTPAICAHSREHLALINVCGEQGILRAMITRWYTLKHAWFFFPRGENIKAYYKDKNTEWFTGRLCWMKRALQVCHEVIKCSYLHTQGPSYEQTLESRPCLRTHKKIERCNKSILNINTLCRACIHTLFCQGNIEFNIGLVMVSTIWCYFLLEQSRLKACKTCINILFVPLFFGSCINNE